MKNKQQKIKRLLLYFLMLVTATLYPQHKDNADMLPYQKLRLAYSKTTSLIFPFAIKTVDRGSGDVLAQIANGVENVLLIKAGIKNFAPSNLTVVTKQGRLYMFVLEYNEANPDLSLRLNPETDCGVEVMLPEDPDNEIRKYAELALTKTKKLLGFRNTSFQMEVRISGLYIHGSVIFLRLQLSNNSNMRYDVSKVRFFILDRRKYKRTASQEIELQPILKTSELETIAEQSEVAVVFALPKFTIADDKLLRIQITGKAEDRPLMLDVKKIDFSGLEILNSR